MVIRPNAKASFEHLRMRSEELSEERREVEHVGGDGAVNPIARDVTRRLDRRERTALQRIAVSDIRRRLESRLEGGARKPVWLEDVLAKRSPSGRPVSRSRIRSIAA
jgi:hypothetical protein